MGLLALQAAAYDEIDTCPLDVLGAQTEGMIGYLIEQELGNLLPVEVPFATVLTMVEVDQNDPAFDDPTKFVGPIYDKEQADAVAADKGWIFKQDGAHWRRVVASPEPKRIFEIRPIRWLLEHKTVVICAGGGGVPTMYKPGTGEGTLMGVEAVIDKDLASELLARDLDADLFVVATDVEGVYADWGTQEQRLLGTVTPSRAQGDGLPTRLDGAKGAGGDPFRRTYRASCGDRCAGRYRTDRRGHRGYERGSWLIADRPAGCCSSEPGGLMGSARDALCLFWAACDNQEAC